MHSLQRFYQLLDLFSFNKQKHTNWGLLFTISVRVGLAKLRPFFLLLKTIKTFIIIIIIIITFRTSIKFIQLSHFQNIQ